MFTANRFAIRKAAPFLVRSASNCEEVRTTSAAGYESSTSKPTALFPISIGERTYSPGPYTRPDHSCMASPRRSSGKRCELMQRKGDPRCKTASPYWFCCWFWVRAGLPALNQLPIPALNQVRAHPFNQLPPHRLSHLPVQVLNQLAIRALNQVPAQPFNQTPGR
jgi:hypothetical protein